MKFGVALLSIIPVRKENDDRSEMTSQLLFGEHYKILENLPGWAMIETYFDSYRGWVDDRMISEISRETFKSLSSYTPVVINRKAVSLKLDDQSIQQIFAGSTIPFYNSISGSFTIEDRSFELSEKPGVAGTKSIRNEISDIALLYLNTPYLWGGRSPVGIDCSGFTQVVYKICGIQLPRDTSLQSDCGRVVEQPEQSREGDLAYFTKGRSDNISHTGILLGNNKIIHASGKVRIDRIDDTGIFAQEKHSYSHKLVKIMNVIDP